jgi:CRP-like cAMP-binding protein
MRFVPRSHSRNPKVEEMARVPLFQNLPRSQLELIATQLDEVRAEAGERLVQEGHHNDAFWILLEGQADMYVGDRRTRQVGPGGFFGATSMLDGRPAVATVVTRTPVRALVASAAQFRALEANQTIALRLMSYALERLREDLEEHLQKPSGGSG